MKVFFAALILSSTAATCGRNGDAGSKESPLATPSCDTSWLRGRIAEQSAGGGILGSVTEYRFRGACVYAFAPGPRVADGATTIYRCDGSRLCTLGGIMGAIDCDGVRFEDSASSPRLVWQRR